MKRLCIVSMSVLLWMAGGTQAVMAAETAPAPPATGPSSGPTTTVTSAPATEAKRPTVAELLSHKTASFNFEDATIPTIMDFISKTYDLEIFNAYDLEGLVTMKFDDVTARQAINSLKSSIQALGYTTVESVRGDPPRIVLTVVPTRADAGTPFPIFYGGNPELIPEGNEMRTQIMTFTGLDADKVQTFLSAVIGKQAEFSVNAANKTITLTDTGSHVHAAAALLQTLEKQAAEKKP